MNLSMMSSDWSSGSADQDWWRQEVGSIKPLQHSDQNQSPQGPANGSDFPETEPRLDCAEDSVTAGPQVKGQGAGLI